MNATTLQALLDDRPQTAAEEQANALSHVLGFVLAAGSWQVLTEYAGRFASPNGVLGAAVFSTSMMLVYAASVIYHAMPPGAAKQWAKRLDHAAIFIFIAGSYTPFALGPLRDGGGLWLLAAVWTLAGVGVVFKVCGRLRGLLPSTAMYVVLGWMVLLLPGSLGEQMGSSALQLLVAGGLAYTLGALFFLASARIRFGHLIWHLLVIVGSGCHFFAALSSMA